MKSIQLLLIGTVISGAVMMASSAGAVPINNHSFELSAATHYDGGPGEWSSAMSGIKNAPTASEFGFAAPDGSLVIFAHAGFQKTHQVLKEKLTADTTYTLKMDVVHRGDAEHPIQSMLALGYGAAGPDGGTELARIVSRGDGAPIPKTPCEVVTWTLVELQEGESAKDD